MLPKKGGYALSIFLALVSCIWFFSSTSPIAGIRQPHPNPATSTLSAKVAASKSSALSPEETLDKIRDALPDGQTLSFDEFKKKVGDNAARAVSWAKPKALIRNKDHYVVECEPGSSFTSSGVTVRLQSPVSFDMVASGNSLLVTGISGVKVSLGLGIDLAKVKQVTLTYNADGTLTVSGKAEISVFLPDVPFSFNLSASDLPKN